MRDVTRFPRRDVLLTSLLAASCTRRPAIAVDADTVEEQLISLLSDGGAFGSHLTPLQVKRADDLIGRLEVDGGSQFDQAIGIGSWGSWIGAWDVVYLGSALPDGSVTTRLRERDPVTPLRLVSARQFVYGPSDATADLRGSPVDGGASTEFLYATEQDESLSILSTRAGAFTKLSDFDFRLSFTLPTRTYLLDRSATPALLETLNPTKGDRLGSVQGMAGSSLRRISYLSERLFISRSKDDGGVVVLLRSDTKALMPPDQRPDLTSTCAEAIFVRGQTCRRERLF
jgi:hypothetical protein